MERTAEEVSFDQTALSVFGYCYAEIGDAESAEVLTESLMEECIRKGLSTNPLRSLQLSISHFDQYRNQEHSPYTRDQKVVLSLRFGAGLDNFETARVMKKNFISTYKLVLEAVDIFNKTHQFAA